MVVYDDDLTNAKHEGAPGFEPGTSRSAVECSATELYPHTTRTTIAAYSFCYNSWRFAETLVKEEKVQVCDGA
ncbi:hypothetical protein Y032_0333g2812 [Ancylostoma ceylanicum]|uniref:Uncharacterized protein n=1 Tax=Ancylostoma ceylanicum TaxID=53326 RepID=A0A016RYX6_9BILA|nr:hypothetical protein Y032_0333g2812 [Ancylostoma ceylanicum]